MYKRGITPEQIIDKLHEAVTINHTSRKEYVGMRVEKIRDLKELEQENSCLKKIVADLSLDNEMLKEDKEGPGLLPIASSNSIVSSMTTPYFAGW